METRTDAIDADVEINILDGHAGSLEAVCRAGCAQYDFICSRRRVVAAVQTSACVRSGRPGTMGISDPSPWFGSGPRVQTRITTLATHCPCFLASSSFLRPRFLPFITLCTRSQSYPFHFESTTHPRPADDGSTPAAQPTYPR